MSATVDSNVGTPSVEVSSSGPDTAKQFSFAFHNLKGVKGEKGDAAGFGQASASVDANIGVPSVEVTVSGPDTAKVFTFTFHNLKGEKGDTVSAQWGTITGNIQSQTDLIALISAIPGLEIVVVNSLPAASADTMSKIYLVPSADPQSQNVKDEYITIDNGASAQTRYTWEQIGSTAIDLSDYVTDQDLATALADYVLSSSITDVLRYSAMSLTNTQKTQARTNIGAGTYSKPDTGIPSSDMASAVQTSLGKADSAYQKPDTGIPSTDMTAAVQTSLGKADTALQSFTETDPTVPSWAKQSSKPSYDFSEIGSKPTTLGGYGITDAKIASGVITLGSNSITPLTQHQDISGKADKATTLAGYGITDAKIQNGVITLGSDTITPLTSFTETDPTVPAWAKASTKPTYNYSEIQNTPTIPEFTDYTDAELQTAIDTAFAGL